MMADRQTILCFVSVYLPGYRSGGPVRTIANLVDHFGDEYDLRIVCRDRDTLDVAPYPDVNVDTWNKVGKAHVFYASPQYISLRGMAKLLRETPHDIVYLNSFFAFGFTTLPLLALKLGWAHRKPCLIAPRGEFSQGAIALKATKKRAYIWLVKRLGLYHDLHWQASSDFEKADIIREFGDVGKNISVAPDLTPRVTETSKIKNQRQSGPLRVVFLSRISPKKNLDFLLRSLVSVTTPVSLSIYGPREDHTYWNLCSHWIPKLPFNIKVHLGEQVPQEKVREVFGQHDIFVFPTRGENFGHVIFESLSAGTPVLVSDQTPWQADGHSGLVTLPLDVNKWAQVITEWSQLPVEELQRMRDAALHYAIRYSENSEPVIQNRMLLQTVIQG